MSDDLLITPGSRKLEIKDTSGNVDAKIETDASGNLLITNAGGDISIGDTSSDVFIGDGTNNVDIVFEQNGEIRGTSGVTLTLGASGSSVAMATDLSLGGNDLTNVNDITISGNLTVNGTTTTLDSTNTVIEDSIIELNSGLTGANSKDIGFIFERGTTGNNAGFVWDESADRFTVFTTTDTAASDTVNTSSVADFQAGSFFGNGANLGSLNATNLTSGTVPSGRLGNALLKTGGTMAGSIAMANYNITGVNQLEINDPGEGIVFKQGSSGDMQLRILDDSSDNILQYSGTGAVFDVAGNITTSGNIVMNSSAKLIFGGDDTYNAHLQYTDNGNGDHFLSIKTEHNDVIAERARFHGGTGNINVYGTFYTSGSATIGDGVNASLITRHIEGKNQNSNSLDTLYLNYSSTSNVQIGHSGNNNDLLVYGAIRTGSTSRIDINGNLTNIGNITSTETIQGDTIRLTNDATDTSRHRIAVYDSGSTSYGMALWNTSGTSGDWATLIYGPNQTNRRISFGKINDTSFANHADITEAMFLDLDDNQLHIKNRLTHYGDTDTYLIFDPNRIRLVNGGNTYLDTNSGTSVLHTSTTFGGDVSGTYNAIVVADDSHNHVISNVDGLQTALDGKLSTSGTAANATLFDNMDSTRFLFGSNTSGTNEATVTNWNSPTKTGFYSDDNASNKWSTANWSSIMHVKLYDNNNNYASQLGFDTYNPDLYYRMNNNGTWTDWYEIYHEGHKPTYSELGTMAYSNLTGTPTIPTNNNQLTNGAGYITGNQTITLSGDVSGSGTTSINVTVTDDSHNHNHSDGNFTVNGVLQAGAGSNHISTSSAPFRWQRSSSSQTGQDDNVSVYVDDSNIYFTHNNDADGDASGFNFRYTTGGTATNLLNFSASTMTYKGNTVFHDGYHPNADKWTTSRTLTLSGDVSGSVSFDGSGAINMTNTAVADDSHNHVISNVDGLQTALDAKAPTANPDFTGTADFGLITVDTNGGTNSVADEFRIGADNYATGTAFSGVTIRPSDGVNPDSGGTLLMVRSGGGSPRWFVQHSGRCGTSNTDIYVSTGTDMTGGNRVFHDGYHPNADTLTTARTIGGVSFNGSANINLPGVNTAGNQNTSGTAAGLSGTPNITVGTIDSGNITAGNSSTAKFLRAHYSDGSYMTLEGYGLEMNRGASYIRPTTDGDKTLYIGGADASLDWNAIHFRSANGLYMTGTQFLDTNRNLTNIGYANINGALTVTSSDTSTFAGTDYLNINANVGGVNTNGSHGLHIGWNKSNGGREINMIFDGGTAQADTEMIFTSTDGSTYTDIFQINGTGNVDIKTGGLRIGTTTVIDSSRRFYPANIQSSGTISFLNGSNGSSGSGAQGINVRHIYAGTTYANSTAGAGEIESSSGFKVAGTTRINSVGDIIGTSYYLGGTPIIDTNRNLTNIGSIGCGQITATKIHAGGDSTSYTDGNDPDISTDDIYATVKVVSPKIVWLNDASGDDNYATCNDNNNTYTVKGNQSGAWWEWYGDKTLAHAGHRFDYWKGKGAELTGFIQFTGTGTGVEDGGYIYFGNSTTYKINPNQQSVFAPGSTTSSTTRKGIKFTHGMGPEPVIWYHGTGTGTGMLKIYTTQSGVGDMFALDATNGDGHFKGDVTAFSTTTTSDIKLKENVRDLEGALDTTLKLRGVKFDWKDENKANDQLGFIAQEVEEVLPEIVKEVTSLGDNDETHKSVNYSAVVPILVEAIKEQQTIINRLEERISNLENNGEE